MATVLLSPVGNGFNFLNQYGAPLAGGFIYTYQAGSSTPLTTYTTSSGTIANTNPIVVGTDGRTPSEIWLQTGFSYKFVIKDADGVTIQTLDNLYPILQNSSGSGAVIPSGLIAMWSGSVGSIPSGWLLCNGNYGTPDLRSNFVIGAGSTYSVGQTGGTADAVVVSHTHAATVSDPGHFHNPESPATFFYTNNAGSNYQGGGSGFGGTFATDVKTTGISVSNASAGVSGTNANIPPYYALAYIMKS
jgi:microcystin-dependent protein